MRPAAPGRRPGGGPPPTPPPAPPAHPRDPPAAARRPPGGGRGDGGEGRREVLFNFPLRYLLTIGLVPVFSLRWSLPPALGCIPKQPDSGKTRARRAGGRYRPHTVHGLGLDQKDLGPPRAAPGSGSSRVATSDLRSRLGGPARTRARGSPRGGSREGGDAEARGRPPRAAPLPRAHAAPRPTDRPTDPRLPVAPPGGGGGGVVGGGGARTGDGRTARPLSPPGPRHRPRRRGGSSRARAAARPQPGGRARSGGQTPRRPAGRRRGTRPRGADAHAHSASGANRPSRRGESRGACGREAGTGRGRTAAGKAPAGVGERGAPAGRTGRRDPTPATTTGPHPRHRVARDRPRPPTPRGQQHPEAACGARTRSQGRRPTPEGPAGQGGPRRELTVPFLPSRGRHLPHGHRAFGGTPCLHLGGRRARRALRGQPPAAHPGGAIDRQATLRQA
ncbi:hypothetical protein R6Z07_000001 [Ovis aries]